MPTPKVTPPAKPNPQPVAKVDKKNDVKADDDDDGGPAAKKGDKTRPEAAAVDADDTPDVPTTLQGVFSKWFAPSKPIVTTTTPAQAAPGKRVTTGTTGPTQGTTATTQGPLSHAARGSAAQGWSARTTGAQNEPSQDKKDQDAIKAAAVAAAAAAAATAASAKSADKSGKDAPRRPPPADLGLRVPLVNQAHILARNLTAQTLKNATDLGLKVKSSRTFGVIGTTVTQLVVPPHLDIAQARAALQQMAPDTALSFNQQYRLFPQAKGENARPSLEPAKPSGGCTADRCYGASAIGWQGELSTCARDLKIGVIDTGIDGSHPALSHDPARINFGTIGPEKRVAGNDLHGTGVLTLLAGDPKGSTPGLVPRARFYVADIFFADEGGLPVSTTMHLLEALDLMDAQQVQIINLSLSGPKDDLVQAAIAKMSRSRTVGGVTHPGTIFIAAAGNGGPGAPPSYPAAYAEVLAVTAVGKDLRSYRRANQGDYIDIAAPGVDIWTALPNGRQGFQTGTSFAAPYVTAVVASIYRSLPRVRTKTAVLQRLPVQDLGTPGPDRIYGRGLVNAPASCDPDKTPAIARRVPAPTTKVSAN
ncbi:MAG: S8 family serine peptidase [Hyphomicrobiaceae bacterium]